MPLDLNRVQAVCFDVDGTLSDTDDQFVLRLVKILTPLRYIFLGKYIPSLARKCVMFTEGPGNWAYNLADKIGLDGTIVAIGDRFYQIGIGQSPHPFKIIRGVKEMLERLKARYPLSIISARGQNSTHRFLNQFNLISDFSVVVTGQTCKHTKPYPDPLEWAALQMEVSTASCLMVGDTAVDIQCGKKAGAQTAGVLCGFGDKKELERAGADLILENTAQLVDILMQ